MHFDISFLIIHVPLLEMHTQQTSSAIRVRRLEVEGASCHWCMVTLYVHVTCSLNLFIGPLVDIFTCSLITNRSEKSVCLGCLSCNAIDFFYPSCDNSV